MANFLKGLAGGIETGARLGALLRDKEERERLQEAMKMAPEEINQQRQATPEELGRAQTETQGLAAQDAAMFDLSPQEQVQYAPKMPVEGQRIGLSQYGLGGQTFNRMPTQQEIQQARYGAMADVIAERDPAKAMEMRQRLEDQDFQRQRRPLELENLQGGLTTQKQQQQAAALTIAEQQRQADEQANVLAARNELSGFRKEGPLTAAQIADVSGKYKLDPTQFLKSEDAVNVQEIKDTKRRLSSAALKGEEGLNKFLADRFDPDKTDNIKPKIVKDKTGNLVVMYGDQVLADYGAHKNVMSLVGGIINVIDQNPHATLKTLSELDTAEQTRKASAQALLASAAQIRASDSTVGLNAARAGQIRQMNDATATNLKNSDEAKALRSEYASLDDENDPGGAKRNSVLNQFNMLSVKAGGTIPLGGKQKTGLLSQPVEQKKNDDGTYTAFAKDGGRALYNTYNGEEIPLGMGVSDYQKLKDEAKKNGVPLITGEDNGKLVVKFAGADGKYYDDVEKAKYAKPAPVGTPAAQTRGIDTSRTVVSSTLPTAPTAKPVRDPKESFTEFRNRTVAWDQNRIAYDRYLKEQELKGLLGQNASGLGKRPLVQ